MNATRRMTLAEFRLSGRDVLQLETIPCGHDADLFGPGRVYAGETVIEKTVAADDSVSWCCTIGSDSRMGTLSQMEDFLYEYACSDRDEGTRVPCPPRPAPADVARRYCLILDEVLTRVDLSRLHRANCVPGDLCDDNMAMAEALAQAWGLHPDCIRPDDQETTDVWNSAYALALAANFRAAQVAS